ncbi:MAG TPA: membrane dipeptidase [Myxococcota bacterium]|nr:membrane dipeptidase [Myxococcota bacterium]HOC98685.1 membrane dipeptidase [Myxococcota bacterium]HOH76199.1 membrane dipeptidase [Myxococcota bacterium]
MPKNRIFDLHTHPSLRLYYMPWISKTFHTTPYYSGPHFNPFEFRTRYANLDRSPVKVLMNAHYVIEYNFLRHGFTRAARGAFWAFAAGYYAKLLIADPWKTLVKMIRVLNESVDTTNRLLVPGQSHRLAIVDSMDAVDRLDGDQIGIIHAVEGAHSIGAGLEKLPTETRNAVTRERLRLLKSLGVACVCPSHFYDNPYSPQVESTEIIPRKIHGRIIATRDPAITMRRAEWHWDDPDHSAEWFFNELFRMGMAVDLSHTREDARWKVYDIAEAWKRPVMISHTGLRHFFNHEYNASDEEVRRVRELNGVVGLILSRRWLVDPETRFYSGNDGIQDLIQNMLHIRNICGDVEAIGLGTDFDGMTHPFSDCFKPNQLDRVIHAMKPHFTEQETDKILYGNAVRVMKDSWVPESKS